jgi:2'-5' RNA ligase
MRLFIGIPLASVVVDQLAAVVARLRRRDDGLRWTAPESWHITLEFLGETRPDQYSCLVSGLGELRSPSFPVQLGALGFFDRAGVFFAGVQITGPMLSLQQSVSAATSRCGFVPETRPFHPHITLARAKGQGLKTLQNRALSQPAFACFTAREFILYESFLAPGGARYEMRESFNLRTE